VLRAAGNDSRIRRKNVVTPAHQAAEREPGAIQREASPQKGPVLEANQRSPLSRTKLAAGVKRPEALSSSLWDLILGGNVSLHQLNGHVTSIESRTNRK
jgi:hypothetical protein